MYLPRTRVSGVAIGLLGTIFFVLPVYGAAAAGLPVLPSAAVLPVTTALEVRMAAPSGTRISLAGDAVNATVISPVYADGRLLIPQGTLISGVVEQVGRLGFGLKHVTSDMQYRFDTLHMPDGSTAPIDATVMQVETAKERVSPEGVVRGIYPTANVSSSLASYLFPLAWVAPHFGVPFLGIKVVIARSPDPEIYFPAGTEFVLRLNEPASLPFIRSASSEVPELSARDMADVHRLLAELPQQRTNRGPNHPSDLVNILFLGNHGAIDRAFHAAGWSGAQRSSLLSIYRMYHSMVQRMGYSMAPMTKLTLNGVAADADYQKSLNTFSKRHHIRLWKQGEDDMWLSAATEDVGFRVRDMHLTHATDPDIDNERNKVLNDVAFTGCLDSAALVPRQMADQPASSIQTDGGLAVLRLNDCTHPRLALEESRSLNIRPRPRAIQALIAFRNDLIRTNPAFLIYNSAKLLCERRGGAKPGKIRTSEASIRRTWSRPSVLDLQPRTN